MAQHEIQFKIPSFVEVRNKDVEFEIYADGELFGFLKVSKGSLDWRPARFRRESPFVVYWEEFDTFAATKRRRNLSRASAE